MNKLIGLLLILFVHISAQAQEERKFQLWNNSSITAFLKGKTFIQVAEKIHYTPSANSLDLKFGDLWLKHLVGNWFEYGGGIRIASSKKESVYIHEKRFMAMGAFTKEWKGFQFDFANRFEYRTFEVAKNHFRYVGKLTVDFPSFTPLKLRFFTSEETFVKLTSDHLNQMRFYGGIHTFNSEHINVNLFYALEKNKHLNHWDSVDVFGLNLGVVL